MRARFLLAAVFLTSLSMGCLPGTDFKVSLRIIDAETGEPVRDAWVLVGAYLSIEPPLDPPYNVGLGATRGMSDHKGIVRFKRLEGMYEGEKPQDPLWQMLESRKSKITRRIKGVKGGSVVLFAPGYGAVHQPFGISDNPDFHKELEQRNLTPEEYMGWFGAGPEDWNYKPIFLTTEDLKAKKTITLKVRRPKNPEHRFASFQPEVLWYSAIAASWRTGTSVKEKERIYEFFKEQMKYAAEVSDNPFYKAQWEALKDPEQKKEFIAFAVDKTYESLEADPIPAIPADFRNTRLSRAPAPAPQSEPEIHNHDTTVHVWMTRKVLELLPEEYEEIREHEADIIEGVRAEDSVLRVLKHFYNPYDPEAGYGNNDTALKWGAIGYPDHPKNEWDWEDALRYYREGDKKKAYKALGHVLHLLEDLSVPMHTRKIRHVYYLDAAAEFELHFARLAKQNSNRLPDEYSREAKNPKLVTGVKQPFEAAAKLTFGEFEQEGKTVRFADYYTWESGENGQLVKKPEAATIELMGKHLLPRAIEHGAGVLEHFYASLHPQASASSKAGPETATDATTAPAKEAPGPRKPTGRLRATGEFRTRSEYLKHKHQGRRWIDADEDRIAFRGPEGELLREMRGDYSGKSRPESITVKRFRNRQKVLIERTSYLESEGFTTRWEILSADEGSVRVDLEFAGALWPSPKGDYLVGIGYVGYHNDGQLRLFDSNGQLRKTVRVFDWGGSRSRIVFSEDGTYGMFLQMGAKFNPDRGRSISAEEFGGVAIFDSAGNVLGKLTRPDWAVVGPADDEGIAHVRILPRKNLALFIAGDSESTLNCLDFSGQLLWVAPLRRRGAACDVNVVASPDEEKLAILSTCHHEGEVRLRVFDSARGKVIHAPKVGVGRIPAKSPWWEPSTEGQRPKFRLMRVAGNLALVYNRGKRAEGDKLRHGVIALDWSGKTIDEVEINSAVDDAFVDEDELVLEVGKKVRKWKIAD